MTDLIDYEIPVRILVRAPKGTDVEDLVGVLEAAFEHGTVGEALCVALDASDTVTGCTYDGYAFAHTGGGNNDVAHVDGVPHTTVEEAQARQWDADKLLARTALGEIVDLLVAEPTARFIRCSETDQDMSGRLVFDEVLNEFEDELDITAEIEGRLCELLDNLEDLNKSAWEGFNIAPPFKRSESAVYVLDIAKINEELRPWTIITDTEESI